MNAHNSKNASFFLCCLLDPVADLIPDLPDPLISLLQIALTGEPLQKRTINPVLGHPVEMPLDGLGVA